ncbi:MAG TPA: bifunctional pyr operon transcriptional regulator/uracil phosphoribosyltransferase PyrR [Opitutaceae bacterium]|nr:bifunctional pyr operon transcriptional regulator/uracil phosphoribosyltransferase PyrR [Opitutaceae bacterium]
MATSRKLDARQIHSAIASVVSAISRRHPRAANLLLLGIANGGVVLSRRLAALLKGEGRLPASGTLDISFHRDDIGRHPIPKEFAPSSIPQDVNGATVILVDDVLHSGRTVKAALDELFDHGRPGRVELAVLVDRGGRRLPVAADYCGLTIEARESEKVVVHLDEKSPARDSVSIRPAEPRAPASRPRPRALAS